MKKWNLPGFSTQSLILIVVIALAALSACASTPAYSPPDISTQTVPSSPLAPSIAPQSYSIKIATKAGLGNYLVDSQGMSLYYFTKDSKGKSNATAAIIKNWPVFNPDNISVDPTLNIADFGSIVRDDGTKQATFKGWPLYYFAKDQASGDTLGQGLNNVWFVVDPATLQAAPGGS
jgi:predicted lipoprotein with Yx(FWY)xxD motif